VLQSLLCGHPLLWVHLQKLLDEVYHLWTLRIPIFFLKCVVTGDYLVEYLLLSVRIKRRVSTEHDISDDSQTPHIAVFVVVAFKDLRTHIVRGPDLGRHHFCAPVLEVLRKPEINYFHLRVLPFTLVEDVLGFEVSVGDVLLVQMIEGAGHLYYDLGGLFLGQIPLVDHMLIKLTTLTESSN